MRYYWLIFIPFSVLIIFLFTILFDLFYFRDIDYNNTNLIYIAIIFHIIILLIILFICIIYLYFTIFRSESHQNVTD